MAGFFRWKQRPNLVYDKDHGEQSDADSVAAEFWPKNEWPIPSRQYSASDWFSADETSLYFRRLPRHTYVFQDESIRGSNICKEIITIM